MSINFWAVIVCAVLSMVVGAVWYGPLFGKKWCEIIGADPNNKDMQKKVGLLYAIQFIITLLQLSVLAIIIQGSTRQTSGIEIALWAFVGFVLPIIAGSSLWNNETTKNAWARFLIQSGYQLIMFVVYGLILGYWK